MSLELLISPIDKTGGLFNFSDSGVEIFSGAVISAILISFLPPGGIIIMLDSVPFHFNAAPEVSIFWIIVGLKFGCPLPVPALNRICSYFSDDII